MGSCVSSKSDQIKSASDSHTINTNITMATNQSKSRRGFLGTPFGFRKSNPPKDQCKPQPHVIIDSSTGRVETEESVSQSPLKGGNRPKSMPQLGTRFGFGYQGGKRSLNNGIIVTEPPDNKMTSAASKSESSDNLIRGSKLAYQNKVIPRSQSFQNQKHSEPIESPHIVNGHQIKSKNFEAKERDEQSGRIRHIDSASSSNASISDTRKRETKKKTDSKHTNKFISRLRGLGGQSFSGKNNEIGKNHPAGREPVVKTGDVCTVMNGTGSDNHPASREPVVKTGEVCLFSVVNGTGSDMGKPTAKKPILRPPRFSYQGNRRSMNDTFVKSSDILRVNEDKRSDSGISSEDVTLDTNSTNTHSTQGTCNISNEQATVTLGETRVKNNVGTGDVCLARIQQPTTYVSPSGWREKLTSISSLESEDLMLDLEDYLADQSEGRLNSIDQSRERLRSIEKSRDRIPSSAGSLSHDRTKLEPKLSKDLENIRKTEQLSTYLQQRGSGLNRSDDTTRLLGKEPVTDTQRSPRNSAVYRQPSPRDSSVQIYDEHPFDQLSYDNMMTDVTNVKTMLFKLKRIITEGDVPHSDTQSLKNGFVYGNVCTASDAVHLYEDRGETREALHRENAELKTKLEEKDIRIKQLEEQLRQYRCPLAGERSVQRAASVDSPVNATKSGITYTTEMS